MKLVDLHEASRPTSRSEQRARRIAELEKLIRAGHTLTSAAQALGVHRLSVVNYAKQLPADVRELVRQNAAKSRFQPGADPRRHTLTTADCQKGCANAFAKLSELEGTEGWEKMAWLYRKIRKQRAAAVKAGRLPSKPEWEKRRRGNSSL